MELTPRMEESVEDMTAAATAPKPITEIAFGVKYWKVETSNAGYHIGTDGWAGAYNPLSHIPLPHTNTCRGGNARFYTF